jgi:hypothetical protein
VASSKEGGGSILANRSTVASLSTNATSGAFASAPGEHPSVAIECRQLEALLGEPGGVGLFPAGRHRARLALLRRAEFGDQAQLDSVRRCPERAPRIVRAEARAISSPSATLAFDGESAGPHVSIATCARRLLLG